MTGRLFACQGIGIVHVVECLGTVPEIDLDKIMKIMGLQITFVTSANKDEEAYALLKHFGLPFKNNKNFVKALVFGVKNEFLFAKRLSRCYNVETN